MSRETLRARLAAATPGPWHSLPAREGTGFDDRMGAVLRDADLSAVAYTADRDYTSRHASAALIAHARQDLPALLALADAAEALRDASANGNEVKVAAELIGLFLALRDVEALP